MSRNPDNEPGVWCYTTDIDRRWELCDVPTCSGTGEGTTDDGPPGAAPPTEVQSNGDTNGESVCEGHGYDIDECWSKDCCHWDDGECWSSVGSGPCESTGGEYVCEGRGFSQAQCLSKGCCHWLQGKCWSSVGANPCDSGVDPTGNVVTFDENEFEISLKKAPGKKLIEYTTKIQCEVLKIQAGIVMDALVFTGCSVDLEGANSFDSSQMECDERVVEAIVSLTMQETEQPHIKLIEKVRGFAECGNKNGTWEKDQVCASVTRVFVDLGNDVFRMCVAPYPDPRFFGKGCNWWTTTKVSLASIVAGAGCVGLSTMAPPLAVACVATALGVAVEVVQCGCKMLTKKAPFCG